MAETRTKFRQLTADELERPITVGNVDEVFEELLAFVVEHGDRTGRISEMSIALNAMCAMTGVGLIGEQAAAEIKRASVTYAQLRTAKAQTHLDTGETQ